MPTPSLDVSLKRSHNQLDRLYNSWHGAAELPPQHQHLIAEILTLRSFAILEDTVREISLKIAAGARYMNGTQPLLLNQANNMSGAETLLLSFGRQRPIRYLKFTNSQFVESSVKKVIDPNDWFVKNTLAHGAIFDEMRRVRNYLAHRNTDTRKHYLDVIIGIYGAKLNLLPGPFLTSTKRHVPANFDRYLISTKVIINDMVKGN